MRRQLPSQQVRLKIDTRSLMMDHEDRNDDDDNDDDDQDDDDDDVALDAAVDGDD